MYWFVNLALVIALILLANILFVLNVKKSIEIPLVVNLNHPFMESGSVSNSEIMVKFTDKWLDPGINRLKLSKDAIGCWIVHRQDEDLSVLSVWETNHKESMLNSKLMIINQAISETKQNIKNKEKDINQKLSEKVAKAEKKIVDTQKLVINEVISNAEELTIKVVQNLTDLKYDKVEGKKAIDTASKNILMEK